MRTCSPVGPRRRRASAAALGVVLLAVPAAALTGSAAAAPSRTVAPSGSSYVAETKGGHVALVLSRDARQVTRAYVGYTYACTDDTTFGDVDQFKAIPLRANRTFRSTYDSGPIASSLFPGVTLRYTGLLTGKRDKRGTKVVGTARFTVVTTLQEGGESVTCDTGTIGYTAKD